MLVANRGLNFTDELLHRVANEFAFGQKEWNPSAHIVGKGEKAQLAAKSAVILADRLLQLLEMGVQLLLSGEERPVDALKLRPVLIAPPVCPGAVGELEWARSARCAPRDRRGTDR